jgi:AraC-like DNA-binding protein
MNRKLRDPRSVLGDFSHHLSRRGFAPGKLLKKWHLDNIMERRGETAVNLSSIAMLLEEAAIRLNDDGLGAKMAASRHVNVGSINSRLAACCSTLHQALRVAVKYHDLPTGFQELIWREGTRRSELLFDFDLPSMPHQQLVDYVVVRTLIWIRWLLRDNAGMPDRVDFRRAIPHRIDCLWPLVGDNIRFNAESTCVHLGRMTLRQLMPGSNQQVFTRLLAKAEVKLKARQATATLVDGVNQRIAQFLPNEPVTLGSVASALNMTPRTLQRALAGQGVTFGELLEFVRIERAEILVSTSSASLTEIALQLGYSELSAFSRAAKIWFGQSPYMMRKRQKERTHPAKAALREISSPV